MSAGGCPIAIPSFSFSFVFSHVNMDATGVAPAADPPAAAPSAATSASIAGPLQSMHQRSRSAPPARPSSIQRAALWKGGPVSSPPRRLTRRQRRELAKRMQQSIREHIARLTASNRGESSPGAVDWRARSARLYSDAESIPDAAGCSFGAAGYVDAGNAAFKSSSAQRPPPTNGSGLITPAPGAYERGASLHLFARESFSRSSNAGSAAFGVSEERPTGLTSHPKQTAGLNCHYHRGVPVSPGPGEYDGRRVPKGLQSWESPSLHSSRGAESRFGSSGFATGQAKGGHVQELRCKEAAAVPSFNAYDADRARARQVYGRKMSSAADSVFRSTESRFAADDRVRRARAEHLRDDVSADALGHTMLARLKRSASVGMARTCRRDDLFERCDDALPGGPYRKMASGSASVSSRSRVAEMSCVRGVRSGLRSASPGPSSPRVRSPRNASRGPG